MERDATGQETEIPTPQVETSTETPPVNNSPSIDSTGRELYLSVLREKEQENERLRKQLEEKSKPAPAPITEEQEREFFSKPVSATQELIKRELENQLQPLKEFVFGLQKTSAYDRVKSNFKQTSTLGKALTPDVEQYVDQLMQGVEPTEQTLTAAVLQVVGAKAAGLLTVPNSPTPTIVNNPPTPNTPPNPATMTNPPHLRPSAPPAPKLETETYKKPLTENERRLMREWGMTEEEYRAGQVRNEDNVGAMVLEPETTSKKKEGK